MKWNSGRFWGFVDEIALKESPMEKLEAASKKLEAMSEEDRAEITGLLEDYMEELSRESVYRVLLGLNGGNPFSDEGYRGCLAGIISNGRDFYEAVLERPEYLQEVYPELSMFRFNKI